MPFDGLLKFTVFLKMNTITDNNFFTLLIGQFRSDDVPNNAYLLFLFVITLRQITFNQAIFSQPISMNV